MEPNNIPKLMLENSKRVAERIIPQMREVARIIDESTGATNLGINTVINALAYSLEEAMSDFAKAAGKPQLESYQEFQVALHTLLNEWIARFSKSGRSYMVKVEEEDHHEQETGGASRPHPE